MIVGRGTYLPELQSQIDIAGVGNLIEVPGYLPDDDLRAAIHRAGCVVIPSLYEPFGVVALEALAGGAPLIVADTGGLAELVGGTGSALLFEPGNADELANCIERVLTDDDLADEHGQARRGDPAGHLLMGRDRRAHDGRLPGSPGERLTAVDGITSPAVNLIDRIRFGTGAGRRTHPGRGLGAVRGCSCPPAAERHTCPPGDRHGLRACTRGRECGGAVVASRERVRRVPRAGSRQPCHDRCRARAHSPRQAIAAGDRQPRVLHGMVVRRIGCRRVRATRGGSWSGWTVGPRGIATVLLISGAVISESAVILGSHAG